MWNKLALACTAAVLSAPASASWIYADEGWIIVLPQPVGTPANLYQADTSVWLFSSSNPLAVSDPALPPYVYCADAGPWTPVAVDVDPYGVGVPYTGIRFDLTGGGDPLDVGESAWFIGALGAADPTLGQWTVYYEDSEGIVKTLDDEMIDDFFIPYFDDPLDMYDYIIETYFIPAPAACAPFIVAAGLASVRRRRQV